MAAEHRIIGGGLLFVGVVVVVLLLVFFKKPAMSPDEAGAELLTKVYPAYAEAERKGDYLEMKNQARRAAEILNMAGANFVKKYLLTEGTTNAAAARVERLIADGAFEKNAEDRFELDGAWYAPESHRALRSVKEAAEEGAGKGLRALRELASDTAKALEDLRIGSGRAVEPPAASALAGAAPDAALQPLLAADLERFRVFAVPARDIEAALAAPDPGGKSTSARLRWNRDVAAGSLGTRLEELETLVEALRRGSVALGPASRALASDAAARQVAAGYLKRLGDAIGAGQPADVKAALGSPETLARFLQAETEALLAMRVTAREMGAAMRKPFPN